MLHVYNHIRVLQFQKLHKDMPCYLLILHVMILHISFCDCDTCITDLKAHGGVCCPDKLCPEGFKSGSKLGGKCSGSGMKCCVVGKFIKMKLDF